MGAEKFRLLNIEIDNWDFQEFVEQLTHGVVITPNVDHMIKLQHDKEFYDCYLQSDHLVCDSRVLLLLSRFLSKQSPIKAQIAGSDLFPAFCCHHGRTGSDVRVFLLGGGEESVKVAQASMNRKAGAEVVVGGYSPPFGFERDAEENQRIIDLIQASGANVLAVGVGAPKQEKWIMRNRHLLPQIRIYFAIGATIEFEAGGIKRSPVWMTKLGVEWIHRMSQEPRRLARRYLIEDLPIFGLVLKQKLGFYRNPWDPATNSVQRSNK